MTISIKNKLIPAIFIILQIVTISNQYAQTNGFTVPTNHPRIWWNADTARINKAKRYYQSHPFTIKNEPEYYDNQLAYILTGDAKYARAAIDYYIKEFPNTNPEQDAMRWYGENALLTYDWCYYQMTPAERDSFISMWNNWIEEFNNASWGNIGMEENNYYQGYLRNGMEWGIASFHESTQAQHFLDHALKTRWEESYVPWAFSNGLGGVPPEGTQYGRYQMGYLTIPLVTVSLMGRNLLRENPFFKNSVFYLIYSTSSVPMYTKSTTTQPYYQLYQFSDDERNSFTEAADVYYGNIMSIVANEWKNAPLGRYAKAWIKKVNCERDFIIKAFEEEIEDIDLTTLPLDYYAPGFKNFYVNSSWNADATSALFQFGYCKDDYHHHLDWGTFQIRRGDRWLTRETPGYWTLAKGFRGGYPDYTDLTLHHNGIVFTGRGWTLGIGSSRYKYENRVLRLESKPAYAYAVVDLSGVYQNEEQYNEYTRNIPNTNIRIPRDANPFAKTVIREFIFLRNLETTIVFDRLEAKDDNVWGKIIPENPYGTATFPATSVVKSFILHSQYNPTVLNSNNILIQNGNHALKMTTLVPSNPSYSIVDDGDFPEPSGEGTKDNYPDDYQYRIEVSDSGSVQSYFLHVLQAKGKDESDLTIDFSDNGTYFDITLSHPSKGNAHIILNKGMTSTGGQIGVSASGTPVMQQLTDKVQSISVTDEGPVWGPASSVPSSCGGIIQNFQLHQNYPNPFNPSTKITFSVITQGLASLKIYDILGREIATLVNGILSPGEHTVEWKGTNSAGQQVTSGIYFYQLKTSNGFVDTKKMMLLR